MVLEIQQEQQKRAVRAFRALSFDRDQMKERFLPIALDSVAFDDLGANRAQIKLRPVFRHGQLLIRRVGNTP